MSTAEANEMGDVLDRVKTWPPPQRITLARHILETLEVPATEESANRPTIEEPRRSWPIEKVLGLLKTDREPPDDEECRRIIEEERWKKYGS
jgi:hypothetical protein